MLSRHVQKQQSSSVQTALDTTSLVLTTLRDAGRLTPIPYLQEAAALALGIVTTIQVWFHVVSHCRSFTINHSRELEITKTPSNVSQMMRVAWSTPLSYPCVGLQIIQHRMFRRKCWITYVNWSSNPPLIIFAVHGTDYALFKELWQKLNASQRNTHPNMRSWVSSKANPMSEQSKHIENLSDSRLIYLE